MHNLINEHIAQSFVYSIMSSHFDTDAENRLGFGKYLGDLADAMWNNAVEIVKYTGKRGGSVAPLMDNSGSGLRISGDVRTRELFQTSLLDIVVIPQKKNGYLFSAEPRHPTLD